MFLLLTHKLEKKKWLYHFNQKKKWLYHFNLRIRFFYFLKQVWLQVLGNCRSMSKFGGPFRSMVVTGGFRQRTQLENLQQDIDVLIATPGRFMFLMKEGFLHLTNLRWYLSFSSLLTLNYNWLHGFFFFSQLLILSLGNVFVPCFFYFFLSLSLSNKGLGATTTK